MLLFRYIFFFKQKTAYEVRISDWSSDVCSSDLTTDARAHVATTGEKGGQCRHGAMRSGSVGIDDADRGGESGRLSMRCVNRATGGWQPPRSEEHTSELQSLMRISYAVFCLKKKINYITTKHKQYASIQQSHNNQTHIRHN